MKLRFKRKKSEVDTDPDIQQAAAQLAAVAEQYEDLRKKGVVRRLEPSDIARIRALGIEIDVQGRQS